MPKQKSRVIIDTNLWISFLLTKDYSRLDILVANKLITFVFSQELFNEFIEVAQRPKFQKYFSNTDLQFLLLSIKEKAELVFVNTSVYVCRDPKDNFLLALAKDGKVDYLLTGDNDLLIMGRFGKTKIVTISKFFEKIRRSR